MKDFAYYKFFKMGETLSSHLRTCDYSLFIPSSTNLVVLITLITFSVCQLLCQYTILATFKTMDSISIEASFNGTRSFFR